MTAKSSKDQSFYHQKRLTLGVDQFLRQHDIENRGKRVVVAVSGGRDSMLLLWLANQFKNLGFCAEVLAAHVHHGVRANSEHEWLLVKAFCTENKIPFLGHRIQGLDYSTKNFENVARNQRRSWLKSLLKGDDHLWMGHHLDDSFEWSLLNQLRSGELKAQIGIPLRNGPIVRPLMTLSRKQVEGWVDYLHLPFAEDESNLDLRFERNFLRQRIVSTIKERHPQYLKHYVHSHRQLAHKFNLLLATASDKKVRIYDDLIGGTWIEVSELQDWNSQEQNLAEIIFRYSNKFRGNIRLELTKLIQALQASKRGPHLFSGNVRVFMFHDRALVVGERQYLQWQMHDQLLCQNYSLDKNSRVPDSLLFWDSKFAQSSDFAKVAQIKKSLSLLPKFSELLLRRGFIVWSGPRLQFEQKRQKVGQIPLSLKSLGNQFTEMTNIP